MFGALYNIESICISLLSIWMLLFTFHSTLECKKSCKKISTRHAIAFPFENRLLKEGINHRQMKKYWKFLQKNRGIPPCFFGGVGEGNNGILLPKLFWPTVRKNCSSDREKFLKFEAEGREFSKFLRSLDQFIQTVKGQNNK